MKAFGAVSLLLISLGVSGCTSYPGIGPHGFSAGSAYAPPAEAAALGDFLVGRYAAMTNDPREAAMRYAASIDTAPESTGITERAVFSALLSGNYRQAVRLAHKSQAVGQSGTLVRLTLGVDAMLDGRNSTSAAYLGDTGFGPFNKIIARGISAWRIAGEEGPDAAEAFLNNTLMGDPRLDSATLYMLGLIQISAERDDEALHTFETLWESGAKLAVGVDAHARLLAARGDRDRALELLTNFRDQVGVNAALEALRTDILTGREIKVERLKPSQGAALAVYVPAAALMTKADDSVAAVYFVLALALDPGLDDARIQWARALESAGRHSDAIAVLSAVPASSPFYATARGEIAWALRRIGHDEEALELAQDALARAPSRELKVQLADLYRSLARYREAERLLTEVVKSDAGEGRTDWHILFARGASLEAMDEWPRAQADLQKALQLQPQNSQILNYLGYAYVDRGEHLEEGLDLIRQALTYDPDSGLHHGQPRLGLLSPRPV